VLYIIFRNIGNKPSGLYSLLNLTDRVRTLALSPASLFVSDGPNLKDEISPDSSLDDILQKLSVINKCKPSDYVVYGPKATKEEFLSAYPELFI